MTINYALNNTFFINSDKKVSDFINYSINLKQEKDQSESNDNLL